MVRTKVDLPAPEKPTMPKNLAFFHADVHMLDRFDGSPAFMKSHRHVVEFNNAHGSFLASFEYLFKFVQYVLFA